MGKVVRQLGIEPQYFRGNASVLINCGETQMDGSVDLLIRDKIGSVLNQISC